MNSEISKNNHDGWTVWYSKWNVFMHAIPLLWNIFTYIFARKHKNQNCSGMVMYMSCSYTTMGSSICLAATLKLDYLCALHVHIHARLSRPRIRYELISSRSLAEHRSIQSVDGVLLNNWDWNQIMMIQYLLGRNYHQVNW